MSYSRIFSLFLLHFHYKILDYLGQKREKNFIWIFLWHFQWQKSRISRTSMGRDFFNFLWHFQWQNSRLPGTKSENIVFKFFVTFSVAKITWFLEPIRVKFFKCIFRFFCDISSGYFEVQVVETHSYIL